VLEERFLRDSEAWKVAGVREAVSCHRSHGPRARHLREDEPTGSTCRTGPRDPADDAVSELRRIFDVYRPVIPYYQERPTNPLIAGWRDCSSSTDTGLEAVDERGSDAREPRTRTH
jgi:hypothetical protein